MRMIHVCSDDLESVGYDKTTHTLCIGFVKQGALYEYYNVPEQIFDELLSAPSKGKYFHSHIRGVYDYQRIG